MDEEKRAACAGLLGIAACGGRRDSEEEAAVAAAAAAADGAVGGFGRRPTRTPASVRRPTAPAAAIRSSPSLHRRQLLARWHPPPIVERSPRNHPALRQSRRFVWPCFIALAFASVFSSAFDGEGALAKALVADSFPVPNAEAAAIPYILTSSSIGSDDPANVETSPASRDGSAAFLDSTPPTPVVVGPPSTSPSGQTPVTIVSTSVTVTSSTVEIGFPTETSDETAQNLSAASSDHPSPTAFPTATTSSSVSALPTIPGTSNVPSGTVVNSLSTSTTTPASSPAPPTTTTSDSPSEVISSLSSATSTDIPIGSSSPMVTTVTSPIPSEASQTKSPDITVTDSPSIQSTTAAMTNSSPLVPTISSVMSDPTPFGRGPPPVLRVDQGAPADVDELPKTQPIANGPIRGDGANDVPVVPASPVVSSTLSPVQTSPGESVPVGPNTGTSTGGSASGGSSGPVPGTGNSGTGSNPGGAGSGSGGTGAGSGGNTATTGVGQSSLSMGAIGGIIVAAVAVVAVAGLVWSRQKKHGSMNGSKGQAVGVMNASVASTLFRSPSDGGKKDPSRREYTYGGLTDNDDVESQQQFGSIPPALVDLPMPSTAVVTMTPPKPPVDSSLRVPPPVRHSPFGYLPSLVTQYPQSIYQHIPVTNVAHGNEFVHDHQGNSSFPLGLTAENGGEREHLLETRPSTDQDPSFFSETLADADRNSSSTSESSSNVLHVYGRESSVPPLDDSTFLTVESSISANFAAESTFSSVDSSVALTRAKTPALLACPSDSETEAPAGLKNRVNQHSSVYTVGTQRTDSYLGTEINESRMTLMSSAESSSDGVSRFGSVTSFYDVVRRGRDVDVAGDILRKLKEEEENEH
ncbi:hypothetical protein DFJ73DRAFT_825638 [Zopfochytrium polystomum]|nr:hypothetical protein DFJ73DRAFT_825638 [Zopfochytrium polystomum]